MRIRTITIISLGTLAPFILGNSTWAFEPQSNGNGVQWESASAEAWSGASQSNSSGAVLELAGAADSSVDTVNGNGVTAYIGLLDPILPEGPGDTPTPTATGTAMTPTETPAGTPCFPAMADEDYDLNGDGFIDARDLIWLIEAIDSGMDNPFDLNCDGVTDEADLIRFSKEWKIAVPAAP